MGAAGQFARGLDYVMLACVLLLLAIGLTTVLSSALKSGLGEVSPYFSRQLMWALLGLLIMAAAVLVDYRFVAMYAYHFYVAILVFLLIVLVMGREVHGAQRWFRLVGLQVQPSEIVKLATLFALAHYLDEVRERIREFQFLPWAGLNT